MNGRHIFVHDGSFPGFLCAAAELLNAETASCSDAFFVRGPQAAPNLFDTIDAVRRDDDRARRLWERLGARVSESSLAKIMEAFLSDIHDADEAAAVMLVRLWLQGSEVLNDLSNPYAALLERAACRTTRETHRFLGLVRFAELRDGTWYSAIEPDCDILALIADHFAARFPLMPWIIHDARRAAAVLHKPGHPWIHVADFHLARTEAENEGGYDGPPLSAKEETIREAWKNYFTTIAIEGRKNPRLQTSFLPKKHRKNLPEIDRTV